MKPSDFYMGMSEFLSVLIPGFIVAAGVSMYLEIITYKNLTVNEWAALLVASYILGHILFALGSYWDDFYDKIKSQENNELLDKIHEIRLETKDRDCENINKYKWCRSVLSKIHPEGYAEVLRKEADSKLFRSLIIPLVIWSIIVLIKSDAWLAVVPLVLAFIAFWRYKGQRFKACRIAYTHVIILNQLDHLYRSTK